MGKRELFEDRCMSALVSVDGVTVLWSEPRF
jgi:hypothetical protein